MVVLRMGEVHKLIVLKVGSLQGPVVQLEHPMRVRFVFNVALHDVGFLVVDRQSQEGVIAPCGRLGRGGKRGNLL